MEARLDRIIEMAQSLLKRFEGNERLSSILPQARLLADMNGDALEEAWLDLEIRGLETQPEGFPPGERTEEKRKAVAIFTGLHVTALQISYPPTPGTQGPFVAAAITVLEHLCMTAHPEFSQRIFGGLSDTETKRMQFALEAERIVNAVRAHAYKYVGGVWQACTSEKEKQALLGPDYLIVVGTLDSLQTGVGQELEAALVNLRNPNPANWSLAALGCRTAIMKLGNLLWQVPLKTYYSHLDDKELDVGGQKEVNRLKAYVAHHHGKAESAEDKENLREISARVSTMYKVSCKGKQGMVIRHEEAQGLIVDTFDVVSRLQAITGLVPLESL